MNDLKVRHWAGAFGLGLAISGLATSFWMAGHRRHHLHIKHI
jgi:hypothetical protein